MALADLVVVMNQGRIEQQGTPREVFNRPRTDFVARFIGGHNVLDATPAGHRGARRPLGIAAVTPTARSGAPAAADRDVEYQGTYVQSSLDADGGTDLLAPRSARPPSTPRRSGRATRVAGQLGRAKAQRLQLAPSSTDDNARPSEE